MVILKDLAGLKPGPFSHLCAPRAAGSGVAQACPRGREAWVGSRRPFLPLPPPCAPGRDVGPFFLGCPPWPAAACLLLAFWACCHGCERCVCVCSRAGIGACVQGCSRGPFLSGARRDRAAMGALGNSAFPCLFGPSESAAEGSGETAAS